MWFLGRIPVTERQTDKLTGAEISALIPLLSLRRFLPDRLGLLLHGAGAAAAMLLCTWLSCFAGKSRSSTPTERREAENGRRPRGGTTKGREDSGCVEPRRLQHIRHQRPKSSWRSAHHGTLLIWHCRDCFITQHTHGFENWFFS